MNVTDWKLIALGIFGSACVELLYAFKVYQSGRNFPKRYRLTGFWCVRCLLAVTGGVFAWLYRPENDILAVHIGASTPLLIAAFAERIPSEARIGG